MSFVSVCYHNALKSNYVIATLVNYSRLCGIKFFVSNWLRLLSVSYCILASIHFDTAIKKPFERPLI